MEHCPGPPKKSPKTARSNLQGQVNRDCPPKKRQSKSFYTPFTQVEKECFSIYEKQNIITNFSHPLTTKIDYLRHPNLTPIDSVQELNGGSLVPYNQYVRAS